MKDHFQKEQVKTDWLEKSSHVYEKSPHFIHGVRLIALFLGIQLVMNPDNEVHLDRIIDYFLDEISNFYPAAPYITPVSQSKNKHINFIF